MPVHSQHFIRRGVLLLLAGLFASPSALLAEPQQLDHQDLSYYANADREHLPIHTAADWQHRREHILAGMQEAMGPLPHPAKPVPLDVQLLEEHQEDGYIRRKIAYHTDDPNQVIHAWLLLLPLRRRP